MPGEKQSKPDREEETLAFPPSVEGEAGRPSGDEKDKVGRHSVPAEDGSTLKPETGDVDFQYDLEHFKQPYGPAVNVDDVAKISIEESDTEVSRPQAVYSASPSSIHEQSQLLNFVSITPTLPLNLKLGLYNYLFMQDN